MPVYEYKCKKCGELIEKIFPIKKALSIIVCWKCGYLAKKIISKSNFHLKGGGWAKDGY